MKKYSIVEFEEKNVCVVPSCWISDDRKTCAWPPKKLSSLRKKCSSPQDNWESYAIVKIYGSSSKLVCLIFYREIFYFLFLFRQP